MAAILDYICLCFEGNILFEEVKHMSFGEIFVEIGTADQKIWLKVETTVGQIGRHVGFHLSLFYTNILFEGVNKKI